MAKAKPSQTYQYKVSNSILGTTLDEYSLSENEFYRLYSFFVTYSMCRTLSAKKRSFVDYGWASNAIYNSALGAALNNVLNLNKNPNFVFTENDDLSAQFVSHNLQDGQVVDLDYERGVIAKTTETSNLLKLFFRIRDGFAHGKFKLRYSSTGEKMVVIQDDNGHNVTARIVIKLSTLLNYINAIDIHALI